MALRGLFEGIFQGLKLEWIWQIQLLEVDVVPLYVLRRSRLDLAENRRAVTQHLIAQRRKHEEFSDRHFVYFVGRRSKVRLASAFPARLRGKHVDLRLRIGRKWLARTVVAPTPTRVVDGIEREPRSVQVHGDRDLLTFHYEHGGTVSTTIFDCLMAAAIDLGLSTTVEYVGMTASPEERPTSLEHRGLTEAADSSNPEVEDIVIMFHTFHVRQSASAPSMQLDIVASNSLTNQLSIRPESELIEKLLINHFEPRQQVCSLARERATLQRLETELGALGVKRLQLRYEVDANSDAYRLGSPSVRSSRFHCIDRSLGASPRTTADECPQCQ